MRKDENIGGREIRPVVEETVEEEKKDRRCRGRQTGQEKRERGKRDATFLSIDITPRFA